MILHTRGDHASRIGVEAVFLGHNLVIPEVHDKIERSRQLPRRLFTIERVLALLAETPPRIAEITAGFAPAQLYKHPGPDEWSANDVLAHLRACADVWGNCIATIIAQDTPTLRAISPRTWIKKTNYLEQKFQPSLRAFTKQRTDLLAVLEPLDRQRWSRKATITGAGRVLEWTVLFYATRMAGHERTHLKQFKRIANTMRMKE